MVQGTDSETQKPDAVAVVGTSGPVTAGTPAARRGDPEAAPSSPRVVHAVTQIMGDGGLAGNLVDDPTIVFTGSGRVMVRIRVASSRRVQDQESGQWREGPTVFHDVACWGQAAQNVGEHFRKGDLVLAVGTWQREQWLDHEGKQQVRRTLAARHIGLGVTFKAARYVPTIIEES